jgi:chitosanase
MNDFLQFIFDFFKNRDSGSLKVLGVEPVVNEEPKVVEEALPVELAPVKDDVLQKNKILKIINIFETGSVKTDYSSVFVYNDGPNSIKQVTLGRGFTEFGNLAKVVNNYADAGGIFSKDFQKYVGRVGKGSSLHSDKNFTDLLKKSGSDPVMMDVQDKVFEDKYWTPALKFFNDNQFTHPLSLLVIFDSYLHSGSVLAFLRARFSEMPPSKGGNEKKWVEEYVRVRRNWLATHSRTILRNTVYRCDSFNDAIKKGNWDLSQPVNANGIIV